MSKEVETHAITAGGFSPYHQGHHLVVKKMIDDGHKSVNVFATQSGRRPISPEKKVDYIKTAVGKGVNVGTTQTPFHAAAQLHKEGKRGKLVVYGGSDRAEIADRLRNYNGKEGKHGYYNFEGGIEFRQVGAERNKGAKGIASFSGTDARKSKNPEELKRFLPKELHPRAKEIFKDLQEETMNPIGIFLLGGPGSGKDYVLKNIFSRFDLTEVQVEHIINGSAQELIEQNKNIVINGALNESNIQQVKELLEEYDFDSVYVQVTNKVSRLRNSLRDNPLPENKRLEKWYRAEKLAELLDAYRFNNSINLNESSEFEKVFFASQIEKLLERIVEKGLEIQEVSEAKTFAPVAKHKSGLPKKYVGKLSHSTALKRKAHWKKMSKLSDKDPRAYEPAPGDATSKTKPSKHTLAVRKMMDEQVTGDLKVPHSIESIADKHGVSIALITQALALGKQVEMEHTKDEKTAEIIALGHLWEKPDYYDMLKQMEQISGLTGDNQHALASYGGAEASRKLKTRRRIDHLRGVHPFEREGHKAATTNEEIIGEDQAGSSLSAKAKKSGISVSTLRKVYRRGVAAWNSGHRPGTTPSQWGHARVNSYINKGKTYHTADKDLREETEQINELDQKTLKSYINKSIKTGRADDSKGAHNLYKATSKVARNQATSTLKKKVSNLRYTPIAKHKNPFEYEASRDELGNRKVSEEADINELFEMQLFGTDEYRKHAISMTPGQDQDIADAFADKKPNKKKQPEPATESAEQSCCPDVDSGGTNVRTFRELRSQVKEATKEDGSTIDATPTLTKKRGKGLNSPSRGYRTTLDGMPVVSRLGITEETSLQEAVEYHLENKISFTENVFRPGSDMFFQMIDEAKKLYTEGKYTPTDAYETDMLESNIGEIAEYEGQTVVLDYPIEEGLEEACWSGYTQKGLKKKGNRMVPNCVPVNEEDKTEGKGIGKPWREGGGGAVYVRTGDGGIKKVRFSQSGMKKKFMDPAATRSFVARHHCLTNKDKTSASYWACRYPRFFSNSGKTWW